MSVPHFKKHPIKHSINFPAIDTSQYDLTKIGRSLVDNRELFLSRKERNFHLHIIGAPGKGKSKLMELLIRSDIARGKAGICMIDPTGRLYRDVLQYAAYAHQDLADRFILLDFSGENDFITGFNPIRKNADLSYDRQLIMAAIQKAWKQRDNIETPRLNRWLPNILSLVILNQLTLLETKEITNTHDNTFRQALLKNVQDPLTVGDWAEFEHYNPHEKRIALESSINRLVPFVGDETIRNILGQETHVLDFKKILDEGKILLVNLHGKTKVHQQYTKLIGILIIHEIVRVAENRHDDDPFVKPFYLYIDEFGQLITQEVADALDRVRKRKLFFVLAHQTMAQLEDENTPTLKASVMTDCRVKVVFGGINANDAEYMANELFTGYFNFKTIKHVLQQPIFKPFLRQVETSSTTTSQSTSRGESRTRHEGKSQNLGYSKPEHQIIGERMLHTGGGETESESFSTSSESGTSKSETRGMQWITDHEEKEITTAVYFKTPEELRLEAAGDIKKAPDRQAIIQIDGRKPIAIEIAEVTELIESDYTVNDLSEFKRKSFESNRDCCLSREEVNVDFIRREARINQLLEPEIESFIDLEKINQNKKRKKLPSKKKEVGKDSPFR